MPRKTKKAKSIKETVEEAGPSLRLTGLEIPLTLEQQQQEEPAEKKIGNASDRKREARAERGSRGGASDRKLQARQNNRNQLKEPSQPEVRVVLAKQPKKS